MLDIIKNNLGTHMMSIKEAIEQIFSKARSEKTSEIKIHKLLTQVLPHGETQANDQLFYELIAFQLFESEGDEKSNWGTYFGPMSSITYNDGRVVDNPPLSAITPDMVRYWLERSKSEEGHLLRARYLGLVFDFSFMILSEKPPFDLVKNYIESLILIAKNKLHESPYETYKKLHRALNLSLSYGQSEKVNEIKFVLIDYEDQEGDDDKPGHWGYSYDYLVENRKVKLTEEEEALIITRLEKRLKNLSSFNPDKIQPWNVEEAAKYLANYYKSKQRNEDIIRVLWKVEESFNKLIKDAPPMQVSGWLEQLHLLYSQYGLHDHAEKVLKRIREIGPEVAESLGVVGTESSIKREDIERHINAVLKGSLPEVLERIVFAYLPKKGKAKEQVLTLSKVAPLQYMVTHNLQDSEGRVMASIGPLEKDLEGHIVKYISEVMIFDSPFLHLCLKELKNRYEVTPKALLEYINKALFIEESRYKIVERGISFYLNDDYLSAIHLLIPQLEQAVRNIYEFIGGVVLKPTREKGFKLKTLDELLRDELFISVLSEDLSTYTRILLTDQRGWNMRNNVCHGLYPTNSFDFQSADRLIHAFLCLGLIIKVE